MPIFWCLSKRITIPRLTMFSACAQSCRGSFPARHFTFLPADIVTQVLNFGLPAPIDVQIEGADIDDNREVAARMLHEIGKVPGVADARIQQAFDYPTFELTVDRTKAAQGGYTQNEILPTAY